MRSSLIWKVRALVIFAFVVLASGVAGTHSAAAGDAIYSGIVVDLAPIKATGLGDFANPIGAAVKRSLNKTYAGRIDAKAKSLPVLVVEIETIYYGQEEEDFISKFASHFTHTEDQLSGKAIVRKGKTDVKTVSVLGSNRKSGSWPLDDNADKIRMQLLADGFADAVRDELGD